MQPPFIYLKKFHKKTFTIILKYFIHVGLFRPPQTHWKDTHIFYVLLDVSLSSVKASEGCTQYPSVRQRSRNADLSDLTRGRAPADILWWFHRHWSTSALLSRPQHGRVWQTEPQAAVHHSGRYARTGKLTLLLHKKGQFF